MTIKDLISLNQMITDVEITVRIDGSALLDQLNIGCAQGVEPRFPTMVPLSERYIGTQNLTMRKKAKYIPKSINSWDDGRDYWQVKVNQIPEKWLELEVDSWEVWAASSSGNPRRHRNVNFHGQRLNIIALPSGKSLEVKEPKQQEQQNKEMDGQMSFEDWDIEVVNL